MATQSSLYMIRFAIDNSKHIPLYPGDFRRLFLPEGKKLTFQECNTVAIDQLFELAHNYGYGVCSNLRDHSFMKDPDLIDALFAYLWYMAHETYVRKVNYDWPSYLVDTLRVSTSRALSNHSEEPDAFKRYFMSFLDNIEDVCSSFPDDDVMDWLYEDKMSKKGFANTSLKEKVFGFIWGALQQEFADYGFYSDLFTDSEKVLASIVYIPPT